MRAKWAGTITSSPCYCERPIQELLFYVLLTAQGAMVSVSQRRAGGGGQTEVRIQLPPLTSGEPKLLTLQSEPKLLYLQI